MTRSRRAVRAIVASLSLGATAWSCTEEGKPDASKAALPSVLEVVGTEYAFQAPDSVAPGRTVVRFKNLGRREHELIVMKLHRGVPTDSLLAQSELRGGFREFVEGGNAVLFAPPGETGDGELVVDFEAGRDYLLWCNFRDEDSAPMHSRLGMHRRVHVRAASEHSSEEGSSIVHTPRVVVVNAGDYRFVAPDTLEAGLTEFQIRNVGRQRHEIAFGRLKAGVEAANFLDQLQRGLHVDSLYDDDGAILTAYPGDDNRMAIRAELRAGHEYVILCEFRDHPDAPTHLSMGMSKPIVVRGN